MELIEVYRGITFSWMSHEDGCDFWIHVGPKCADPVFRRQFETPINSTDKTKWILGIDGNGELAAFASYAPKAGRMWLEVVWVREDLRGNGIYPKLLKWRLDQIATHAPIVVRVCANPSSKGYLEAAGFVGYDERGKWLYMEKAFTGGVVGEI